MTVNDLVTAMGKAGHTMVDRYLAPLTFYSDMLRTSGRRNSLVLRRNGSGPAWAVLYQIW